jgi:HEAT repeat protein
MTSFKLNLAVAVALLITAAVSIPVRAASEQEARLIAVLKSDAGQKAKADACRELARIGTKDSVPVLAGMLADEKMNHMARYGLETIPDPSVDAALREALATLKGRQLVGVIGSLGVRRDAQAVAPLARFLSDADALVADAAARAIGSIGTSESGKVLLAALPGASAANQLPVCEGLFRTAERLSASGKRPEAIAIYTQLVNAKAAHQVRAGAARGLIVAGGPEGIAALRQYLRSTDYVLFAAANRAAMELPAPAVTEALVTELGALPADNQIVVIKTLGRRGDAAAIPALLATAAKGPKPVRLAAIRAVPEIGQPVAAPAMVELLTDSDREIAQAAQESLAALPGKEVDAIVVAMLSNSESVRRIAALDLVARRRMTTSMPALLKATTDSDAKVRAAALRRVGELGGPQDMPALLDLLLKAKTGQDVDAAEQALVAICAKGGDAEAAAGAVAARMAQATPEQKGALLRVLSSVGGTTALASVRAAVSDPDAEVRASSIRALGEWKTADAAPDLLALAKSTTNPTERALCLRSYLGLASNPDMPAGQRLAMCRDASPLAQKPGEKKLLLSALSKIQTAQSVTLIAPYLDDADTKEEASAAVVAIAERMTKGRNAPGLSPKMAEILTKVAASTGNADLAKRATALAKAKPAAK